MVTETHSPQEAAAPPAGDWTHESLERTKTTSVQGFPQIHILIISATERNVSSNCPAASLISVDLSLHWYEAQNQDEKKEKFSRLASTSD